MYIQGRKDKKYVKEMDFFLHKVYLGSYGKQLAGSKSNKPNDGPMAHLTRCWADKPHRSMASI